LSAKGQRPSRVSWIGNGPLLRPLDIEQHPGIVRLINKQILVSNETIVVRHSIPDLRHAIEQR
jgi:hypothetical protein